METIPESYENEKLYYWKGIYYYENKPCIEIEKYEMKEGKVVDTHSDYGVIAIVYSSGYILLKTLGGNKYLKFN